MKLLSLTNDSVRSLADLVEFLELTDTAAATILQGQGD